MGKIFKLDELRKILALQRQANKRIVFTNGCFDIMHAGHVSYLAAAREQGDLLVIGLNSDHSVKIIKGASRPIVAQDMRARVLEALACVDYITLFDDPDPLKLILALKPEVLVKGADWDEDRIVGAREVRDSGGDVVRVPLVPDISTSKIIRRILEINTCPEDH
ncbi:MAG: D-glycero-beta-D-manno-heptose 1-phosphate adenylyltransferase [Desulfobacterales bacterium]|nr:D-glycero-beta-D-manno-heptose 1-phosphate adenylyltransferase [Desulfobacterales bacterium]